MNAAGGRETACELLQRSRAELLKAIRGLRPPEMREQLPGGWSVKDILAHVAMWDEMELLEMRRATRGHRSLFSGRFDYALIPRWNEVQFALRRRLSLKQVLAELRETRDEMTVFLASLDETQVSRGYIRTACRVQAEHDREHGRQISDWRKTQAGG